MFHGKCKHIDIRFHFLRDLVNDGTIQLKLYGSMEKVVDILTKPLKHGAFENLKSRFGFCSVEGKLISLQDA